MKACMPANAIESSFVALTALNAIVAAAFWSGRAAYHFARGAPNDFRTASYLASAVIEALGEGLL